MADPFHLSIRPTGVLTSVIDEHGNTMRCRQWLGFDAEGNPVTCFIAAVGGVEGGGHDLLKKQLLEVPMSDEPEGLKRTY